MDANVVRLLLEDVWTLHLTIIGIAVSVMTLLYSFILSRRFELYAIAEQIKQGNTDPILKRKESLAIKYIQRLTKNVKTCTITLLIAFVIAITSWIGARFLFDTYKEYVLFVCILEILLEALFITKCVVNIYKQYKLDAEL